MWDGNERREDNGTERAEVIPLAWRLAPLAHSISKEFNYNLCYAFQDLE